MEQEARKRQIMIWYFVAAMVGVVLVQYFWASYSEVETIPYSQFEEFLNADKVAEVTVGADSVEGTLKEPLPSGKRTFFAVRVDPQLAEKLEAHGAVAVEFTDGLGNEEREPDVRYERRIERSLR